MRSGPSRRVVACARKRSKCARRLRRSTTLSAPALPTQAESLWRPLRRRLLMIARPARSDMRWRNPCLRARRRLLGWYVRFTICVSGPWSRFLGHDHTVTIPLPLPRPGFWPFDIRQDASPRVAQQLHSDLRHPTTQPVNATRSASEVPTRSRPNTRATRRRPAW